MVGQACPAADRAASFQALSRLSTQRCCLSSTTIVPHHDQRDDSANHTYTYRTRAEILRAFSHGGGDIVVTSGG